MHIFGTNKFPRVVLQFSWTGTHLGGKEQTCHMSQERSHHEARPAQQVRLALPGAAAPALCHVYGPSQVLPRVHNLDEQD
jgi:hypothetical protein